ncbi:MAG: hypothetical protein HQM07_05630 [Zetaproteobacteria bacterium]|nr:hypothetical protein [Zetaproteobacteria bacterium]
MNLRLDVNWAANDDVEPHSDAFEKVSGAKNDDVEDEKDDPFDIPAKRMMGMLIF